MTIGRLAEVLTEETGLLSTLRAPAEIPIDPIDLEAFLAAGDFAMAVVLHAFKCGDALDTLERFLAYLDVVFALRTLSVETHSPQDWSPLLLRTKQHH